MKTIFEKYAKFAVSSFLILFLMSGTVFAAASDEIAGVDRYTICIGCNDGGSKNVRLLYAGTDAMSFENTMMEIGGVLKQNSILLLDPTKAEVDDAMNKISGMIERNKENSKRSEFIFYYSGHSDENELLLGKTGYDYSSLKAAISKVPSDVHVVILDSCYSGNFIRTKGGQMKKPFLVDDSSVIQGYAYLSSSSSQESSQESDEIGSSFFTNAMITGLRGAADSSGDKKVTLNELYSYAFSETLSKTENTSTGPQHPNYNITLVGSGDLVLSDISASDCVLTLAKDLTGKVIIRDRNDKLVSEINKNSLTPVFLALEDGSYSVSVIDDDLIYQGKFDLVPKRNYVLSSADLSKASKNFNRTRGSNSEADKDEGSGKAMKNIPFAISFVGNDISMMGQDDDITASIAVGILRSNVYEVNGVMASGIVNNAKYVNGVQAAPVVNTVRDLNGVQGTGVFNYARDINGAQGAGIVNIARNIKYFQGAGIANVTWAEMDGVQAAGISNYATTVRGIQAAGIGNICVNDMEGIQGAGFYNICGGTLTGAQGAGIINVARTMNGAQIGLINVSEECNGFQFGLINISKNGVLEIGSSYTSENDWRITFCSGMNYLYSVLGVSLNRNIFDSELPMSKKSGQFIYGFGSRLKYDIFNFDFEAMITEDFNKDDDDETNFYSRGYPTARFAFGASPVKHFQLFAGALMTFEYEANAKIFENRENNIVIHTGNSDFKLHPEVEVGVKYSFN